MKLIVNADDFGYSKGVNLGIIEAHRAGVVTSTTTMVNMGGFEHAVQLARETPTLGVGIHLVLTCGAPVSHDVPSLTDEHGRFHRGYDYLGTTSPEDVERELRSRRKVFGDGTYPDAHRQSSSRPCSCSDFADRFAPGTRISASGAQSVGVSSRGKGEAAGCADHGRLFPPLLRRRPVCSNFLRYCRGAGGLLCGRDDDPSRIFG